MKSNRLLAVVVGAAAMLPAVAFAQANRGTSTQGAFGQTTMGSTSGASPSGLGTGMTTGMSQNSTQGGSGTNNNSGFGVASETSGMQNLQRGGQNGFVGLSSQNVQNPFSAQQGGIGGRGGGPNFNSLTQLMAQAQRNQFNQQQAQRNQRGGGQQAKSQFRVPMRLGFQPVQVTPMRISGFAGRLTKVPGMSQLGPIAVSLEAGQTAVLRGTVATEADRQLAEGLARLEPEVMEVRNELVVAPQGTTGEALPPPPAPSAP